ncbi:MAG: hypothetical protein HC850_04050 [Rhodomicrobium sp.]|nr:hypothetical protein [Rhodomicrobium sp.]
MGDVVFDGPPSNFNVTLTGTDADKFEIIDNKLYLKPGVVLDYEALPNDGYGSIGYQVDLVADDLTTPQADDATRTINLRINDLDDTARVSFTNEVYSLPENSDTAQPIRIADLTLTNAPDGAYALTLAGNDADKFEIAGNQLFLKAGAALDYETQSSFDVRVQVDDLRTPAAIDDEQYVSFSVEDVNAARVVNRPYENTGIDETIDTTNGVLVGDIILDGPASNFNLTLTGPDADRFQIVGNQLFIKPGAVIDYETEPVVSYGAMPELEVTLEADDLTTPQVGDGGDTVTISINDVNENV